MSKAKALKLARAGKIEELCELLTQLDDFDVTDAVTNDAKAKAAIADVFIKTPIEVDFAQNISQVITLPYNEVAKRVLVEIKDDELAAELINRASPYEDVDFSELEEWLEKRPKEKKRFEKLRANYEV